MKNLAKNFEHLDFSDAPIPPNFNKPVPSHEQSAYVRGLLSWLAKQNQSLNTPDFIDLMAYHSGTSYARLVERALEPFFATDAENKCITESSNDGCAVYQTIFYWFGSLATFDFKSYLVFLMDNPTPSTLNPKKISIWRNTSRYGIFKKRVDIKVRTWLKSSFLDCPDDKLEELAIQLDKLLEPTETYDVRFYDSSQLDGWAEAYNSDKIKSCMSPDCDKTVATEKTYTCYCTAYHGLPDNGLSLAVLYQDGIPVARAITFCDEYDTGYVKVYGDDRLKIWLTNNGYREKDGYPACTILYTNANLLKPFVDGNICSASLEYDIEANKHYWELRYAADYKLDTACAYADLDYDDEFDDYVDCDCCGEPHSEASMRVDNCAIDGFVYTVCDACYNERTWKVYIDTNGRFDTMFFHDGQKPDTNYGFVESGGEYYLLKAMPICECCDGHFHYNELNKAVSPVDNAYHAVCDKCLKKYAWTVDMPDGA